MELTLLKTLTTSMKETILMNGGLHDKHPGVSENYLQDYESISAVFRSLPIGIAFIDEDLYLTKVNQVMLQMIGKPVEEVVNKRPGEGLCCIHSRNPAGCGSGPMCKSCPLRTAVQEVLSTGKSVLNQEISMRLLVGDKEQLFFFNVNIVRSDAQGRKLAVLTTEDITLRKQRDIDLEYCAFYDSLTGVFNRSRILNILKNEIHLFRMKQTRLNIYYFDLNKFKEINDRYGHAAGDKVLIHFSELLKEAFKDKGYVGRIGGDEFLAVIPAHLDSDIGIRLKNKYAKLPFKWSRIPFSLSVSVGKATFPVDAADADELIKLADQRMFKDKQFQRNPPEIQEKIIFV